MLKGLEANRSESTQWVGMISFSDEENNCADEFIHGSFPAKLHESCKHHVMFCVLLVHHFFPIIFSLLILILYWFTLKLLETTKKETVLQRAAKPSEAL